MAIFELARFTWLEILRMRVFHLLIAFLVLIMPIATLTISGLFFFDVSKVQIDVLSAGMHAAAMVYILFIATTLMGRDISSGACYFLLAPPLTRSQYIAGRFLGLLTGLIILIAVASLVAEALTALSMYTRFPIYRHGLEWFTGLYLGGGVLIQYISLLAVAVFICAWATAIAEMLTFVIAFMFLAWTFPTILTVLQSPEILQQVPPFVATLIHATSWLFPELNGAMVGLKLAHGLGFDTAELFAFIIQHVGYTMLMLGGAAWLFSKRSL